jgi:hypothetical protein
MREICKMLDREGIPPRGAKWHKFSLYRVLKRAGYEDPDRPRKSEASKQERRAAESAAIKRDKCAAALRAVELRAHGLSLRQIGERLLGERFLPVRGNRWHAASVLEILRSTAEHASSA